MEDDIDYYEEDAPLCAWEKIHDYELFCDDFVTTHRMKVFGGWMLMIARERNNIHKDESYCFSQFISDANHKWKLG